MVGTTIAVIGLGYIGLPTAIVLLESGHTVVGYDVDHKKIAALNNRQAYIQEPEIQPRLERALATGRFTAVAELLPADYFFIAVPTPCTEEKKADLGAVWLATDAVARVLKRGDTVILESTVPVGTTAQMAKRLEAATSLVAGKDFFVGFCPERVLPGNIFYELVHNERIVGGINAASTERLLAVYATFVQGNLVATTATTAEMVKLVENSSRDVQLAFAHQVATMSYEAGLNPYEVIALANKHPRVNILTPRCGVGGHCIAVDPWFLVETFPSASLLKAARLVNDGKPYEVLAAINNLLKTDAQKTVLVLGVTYKPDVDDIRESPALLIAQQLHKQGTPLLVCDPFVEAGRLPDLTFVELHQGLIAADVIVALVPHRQFKGLDPVLVAGKTVLDFCSLFYEFDETVKPMFGLTGSPLLLPHVVCK